MQGETVKNKKTHFAVLQKAVLLHEWSFSSVKLSINNALHEVCIILVLFEQRNVCTKIIRG